MTIRPRTPPPSQHHVIALNDAQSPTRDVSRKRWRQSRQSDDRRRPPILRSLRVSSSWGASVVTIVDDAGSFGAGGIDRRRSPAKAHAEDQKRTVSEFILP